MFTRVIFALHLFLFFLSVSHYPQSITWSEISTQYALPQGVNLYKGTRTSPALNVWYLKVDLKKGNVAVKPYLNPAGKEGITAFSGRFNAIAAVNGGYFDLASNASYSALINPGTVLAKNIASVVRDGKTYILTRSFWGIKETRDMSVDWIYHFGNRVIDMYAFKSPTPNVSGTPAPAPSPLNGSPGYEIIAGIGGGPTLIDNDTIKITYNEEVFWGSGVGLSNRDPRSAIGFTRNKEVILLVADGRQAASEGLSLPELAQLMKDLGCIEAMNLDGGGSSQMAVGTTLINRPEGSTAQRLIPTMVAVTVSDSLPLLPPVFFNKVIDSGDSSCSLNGSGWTVSGISGYWGSTPSLICPSGNGEQYAKFKLRLPRAGAYRVDAWWVAASNRAANTPFVVRHANGTDTVRADQSINGLKWNTIGTFNFSGTEADEVLITNNAQTGQNVCVDAIRILSFDTTMTSAEKVPDQGFNFELYQNYPNPFNPETTISFRLRASEDVSLSVYDLIGKEISLIKGEKREAGVHNFVLQSSAYNLSSGVYLCRLQAGDYSRTGKMILLK